LFEFKNNYDELKRNIISKLRTNPLGNSLEKYFREIKSVQRRIVGKA
jgi:hypothetical protein